MRPFGWHLGIASVLAALFGSSFGFGSAQAQRGVEFMNSPGYQRALIESRKQRQLQRYDLEDDRSAKHVRHHKRKPRASPR